jgi:hypothetical protein
MVEEKYLTVIREKRLVIHAVCSLLMVTLVM